jgi:hypothetical protein
MGWCISLCADPNSNPDANPHLAGEQQSVATPPGREKMGSPTLQTHQYPILLLPWLWFEVADQTLTHWPQPACWGILVCPPSTAPLGVTCCLCRRPNTCCAGGSVARTGYT